MQALSDSVETLVLWSNAAQMSLQLYRNGKYVDLTTHRLKKPIKGFPHRSDEYDRVISAWLAEYAVEYVHIRHIAWHSLGIVDAAKSAGIPVIFSFHDFYTICPTVKLLDEKNVYCGGTCTATTGECAHELWTDVDFPPLKHRGIHDWKANFATALEKCDAFVTTTESTRATLIANYPFLATRRFEVIPHGRDFDRFSTLAAELKPGEPIRLLVPGNISAAKGGSLLRQIAAQADPAELEIHVLGNINSRTRLKPLVKAHGPYARGEFAAKVRGIRPHAGVVLSIWPETYCHTLTEMWACGLPVIGYDIGAVGDRIAASGAGWLVKDRDPASLYRFILKALREEAASGSRRAAVDRWQKGEGTAVSTRLMAGRYFSLYSSLRPAPSLSAARPKATSAPPSTKPASRSATNASRWSAPARRWRAATPRPTCGSGNAPPTCSATAAATSAAPRRSWRRWPRSAPSPRRWSSGTRSRASSSRGLPPSARRGS